MRKLLNDFYETKAAEAEAKVEREAIKKDVDQRMVAIKAIQEELVKLKAEIQDPSLAVEKRESLVGKFREKEQNLQLLGREHEEFLQRKDRALKEKMFAKMNDLRQKVIAKAQAHAEAQGVDYLFDGSGLTATQVPFLLYVREPVDMTELVLAELNKEVSQKSTPEAVQAVDKAEKK